MTSLGKTTINFINHSFGWQFQIRICLIDSKIKKNEKVYFCIYVFLTFFF